MKDKLRNDIDKMHDKELIIFIYIKKLVSSMGKIITREKLGNSLVKMGIKYLK